MLAATPTFFPDLLHPVPLPRIDMERTRLAVHLAFAGGTSGGLFSEAMADSGLAASSWQPSAFADDLFVRRFVAECFKFKIGRHEPALMTQHLVRVLSHPPADPAIVHYRRDILSELVEQPALRGRLEELYRLLCRLRALLENTAAVRTWDANRRQLDLLGVLKEILDQMSAGFAGARSGLRRLSEFAARVQQGEPYHSLVDLLSYDAELASVTVRLGIGADGRVRGFQVVQVRENSSNPFANSPVRRWLAKLEMFVRGFRFGQSEVMARLLDAVFAGLDDVVLALIPLLADVELYLGALGFRDRAAEAGLAVCLPELVGPEQPRVIAGLFNPLLLVSGFAPIPCDLVTDAFANTVLVTGPNSGGKTRLLQAVGLTQLLAQSGLFIPARAGSIALVPALVVSLIEESKVDQPEGRLGMELLRIRSLFERLPPGAMVLLDELCSGTNPSEGEEIFELVVTMLSRLWPQAFITTHFLTFAARLERERKIPRLGFLQVELDANRRPTYQFTRGVARTSLASDTAERLGVTGEQLLMLIDRNLRLAQGLGTHYGQA